MGAIRLDDFLDDFRTEALEHVRILDTQLLILERDPSNLQPIRTMFASAHTIKGGAAMLELDRVRLLAHAMEDLLDELRSGRRRADGNLADLLFQAIDLLRDLVASSVPGPSGPDPATARLVEVLRGQPVRSTDPSLRTIPQSGAEIRAPLALVVDNSATVRQLVANQLSHAGFEVESASDGREALALVATRPYNLIVASISLPSLDGPDLAAAIRALPERRTLPIVLMGSDTNPATHQRAKDAGADVIIRKGSFRGQELANLALTLVASQSPATQDIRSDLL